MANEKNEAIPLGGHMADGTGVSVKPESKDIAPVMPTGEAPKKKAGGKPVIIVLLLLAVLLVAAVIAAGVTFLFATSDTMPKAPEVSADMSTVIKDSAVEMLKDKKITFNSDEVNLFLKTLNEKSEEKLAEHDIKINDLFAVINNDKATLYCRANYKGITWPIKAVADVSYDDPYIVIGLKSANIGKIDVPTDFLMKYVEKCVEHNDISIHNGCIYYDTTTFNDKLSDMTLDTLGLRAEDLEKSDNGDDSENKGFSIGKWWDNLKKKVSNKFKNWAANVVSDFIHDIKFEDVKILDNEIVIKVSFDEDTSSEVSNTDETAEEGEEAEALDAAA